MTAAGIAPGLHAAWLLARGRPEGLAMIASPGATPAARARQAARSFWAAAVCLPLFFAIEAIDWLGVPTPARFGQEITAELMSFVVGWLGFAVASHWLCGVVGRSERWPVFLVTWNWCNVVQYAVAVVAALPDLLGAPAWIGEVALLVSIGWALWLEWFAARLALGVPGIVAGGFVAVDVVLSSFVHGIAVGP